MAPADAMTDLSQFTTEQLHQKLLVDKHLIARATARNDFLRFIQYTMPDPLDFSNPDKSTYEVTPVARLLADVLTKVEKGELLRVAVSIGPQFGKSEPISRRFPAWFMGRNPWKHFMLGTYNQDFAMEFGAEVRSVMESSAFSRVFPAFRLKKGSQAKDLMITERGGKMAFVGVGGSGSGKPADVFIIDDPIKNGEDAESQKFRDGLWDWFNKVVFARAKTGTAIVIVHTRWHEDDLIGRLCDPDHPERDKKYAGVADPWTYINIPAVVREGDLAKALDLQPAKPTDPLVISQFGYDPIVSLWEGRKSLRHLAEARRLDAPAFDALYMGKPSPDDGDYFKAANLVVHASPTEYPDRRHLKMYGASDHALGEKQTNDYNVMGCFGVDKKNEIWLMPDLYWDRCDTGKLLDEMIALMKRHEPQVWFAEDEHINKSIGPFRRKRMREEEVFKTAVQGLTSAVDLRSRARSIQGRTTQHMVHFPGWAPWWSRARAEMLKFPKATHDDFVSFLSLIGRGLDAEHPAEAEQPLEKVVRVGSIEWVKAASARQKRESTRRMGAL
jgi:predicted phage terminase large subunit-like protein